MTDAHASTRSRLLTVNALGAGMAMELALDKSGDLVFLEPASEWDDEDTLPTPSSHESYASADLAGYEVLVIRRAYSTSPGGSSFDADYAIAACSNPLPLHDNPDIQDQSEAYLAEKQRAHLDQATASTGRRSPGVRL